MMTPNRLFAKQNWLLVHSLHKGTASILHLAFPILYFILNENISNVREIWLKFVSKEGFNRVVPVNQHWFS